MHDKSETICISWCDNGNTDGLFTAKVVEIVLNAEAYNIPINGYMRNCGNQISRQRMTILANWYNKNTSDWLLSIDSDVIVSLDSLKELWAVADKNNRPVVSGIYYLLLENRGESPLSKPSPSVFKTNDNYKTIEPINISQEDNIFKADSAGFGYVLIHRDVISKMIKIKGDRTNLFFEMTDNHSIGEDTSFFKNLKECDIPLYVSKKATSQHIKRFSVGVEYEELWKTWSI